jgi:flagellar protein FliO/FliZ
VLALTIRLICSLAVVIGLLLLITKLSAKRMRGPANSLVKLVERRSLSRSSAISVVTVGNRVLVIGTTENEMRLLTELDPSELERTAELTEAAESEAAETETDGSELEVAAPARLVAVGGTATRHAGPAGPTDAAGPTVPAGSDDFDAIFAAHSLAAEKAASKAALLAAPLFRAPDFDAPASAVTSPDAPASAVTSADAPASPVAAAAATAPAGAAAVSAAPASPARAATVQAQTVTAPAALAETGAVTAARAKTATKESRPKKSSGKSWKRKPTAGAVPTASSSLRPSAVAGSVLSTQTWKQAFAAATGRVREDA